MAADFHRVGFGLMDAAALVAAARTWNSSQSANVSRLHCTAQGQRRWAAQSQISVHTAIIMKLTSSNFNIDVT